MISRAIANEETGDKIRIVRAEYCPNPTMRNAYAAGQKDSIDEGLLLHFNDCINCNMVMFPDHSKNQSNFYQEGHELWCVICRNIK